MERLRNNWIDCIAGLLIIRMILGHYVSYVGLKDSLLFHSLDIFFFYMPCFSSNRVCSIVLLMDGNSGK